MGTWGVGTFENDVALDVRDSFGDAVERGLGVAEATQVVLHTCKAFLEDADDAANMALALAALQLQHGAVTPAIRTWALAVARGPAVWHGWEATDAQTQAERRQYLQAMIQQLTAG